jgi:class 3 adenylate cyclase
MNVNLLEKQLSGTAHSRFFSELFSNSLHFPIANALLEMLIEGPKILTEPDLYTILLACLVQAYFLSDWQGLKRLPGNLIGPAVYTFIEFGMEEKLKFFQAPNHIFYWCFGLAFGLLQAIRPNLKGAWLAFIVIFEEIIRASILVVMYYIFELKTDPQQLMSVQAFFSHQSHRFFSAVAILLGLNSGLANLNAKKYLDLLRETLAKLKIYSEWLLGRDLLGQAMVNPTALELKRLNRAVLFMDIRGFTRWSEPLVPEQVVNMLNRYYQTAESVVVQHRVIKFKFSADEVLAIFPDVDQALHAAMTLSIRIGMLLEDYDLGAGVGLHFGSVVEGLLGTHDVKFYDVIGDTVNTAKRIESVAHAGEVLISDAVRLVMNRSFRVGDERSVTVKGKEYPISVYLLDGMSIIDKSQERAGAETKPTNFLIHPKEFMLFYKENLGMAALLLFIGLTGVLLLLSQR